MNLLHNRPQIVLGLVLALVLGVTLGIGADLWRRHTWAQRTMAEIAPRQARLQGTIDAKAQITEGLQVAKDTLARIAYPPSAGDANRIATDVQQKVRKLAENADMKVSSGQVLPPKSADGFEEITVTLNADGAMENVQSLLLALEQQTPRLMVESLEIRPPRAIRRPQDGAVRVDAVTLRLNISAVRLLP